MQILVPVSAGAPLVAGLPSSVRAAHRAVAELPGARVFLRDADAKFRRRWRRQLAGAAEGEPDPNAPLLTLQPDGFPEPGALSRFLGRAASEKRALRWLSEGRPAGWFRPATPASDDDAEAVLAGGWVFAATSAEAAEAQKRLLAGLPKDTDGYIARLDRRLSIALSLLLLRWPVTPNHITTASLALGLLGSWWLASGSYGWTLAGAFLLWLCCLLDGCDGEVARLKLLCSPSGAAYDLWADHLAHLATFVALPLGVHRAHPELSLKLPGLLLVTGFLACGFTVWRLVLSKPESERGPYGLLIERVASRDYVYLIAALALIGRLDWFVYAAAAGSHVFWIALWLLPTAPAAASPTPAE